MSGFLAWFALPNFVRTKIREQSLCAKNVSVCRSADHFLGLRVITSRSGTKEGRTSPDGGLTHTNTQYLYPGRIPFLMFVTSVPEQRNTYYECEPSALELNSTESRENGTATLLHVGCGVDSAQAAEQATSSPLTEQDPWSSSIELLGRFQRFGNVVDLQRAITVLEELRSTPGHLINLGNSFLARFERLGELTDFEDAMSRQRDAVDLTPDDHPDKPGCLNSLGHSFFLRFERLGELSDIEDAISGQRNAVELSLDGHPHKPKYLNNLGNSLQVRFDHLGELTDLADAISALGDAVDLTPHGDPDKPACLSIA
ncbi:hypothetical protein EV363DRAFT_1456374 [Boletus edulis]|nr:hypothetical protein EV363DRAFT_1456374 [Boletus edulis]